MGQFTIADTTALSLLDGDVIWKPRSGNVKKLEDLPPNCRAGTNANAFVGGFRLWEGNGPDTATAPVAGPHEAAVVHADSRVSA